jgi:hypothetical protein
MLSDKGTSLRFGFAMNFVINRSALESCPTGAELSASSSIVQPAQAVSLYRLSMLKTALGVR